MNPRDLAGMCFGEGEGVRGRRAQESVELSIPRRCRYLLTSLKPLSRQASRIELADLASDDRNLPDRIVIGICDRRDHVVEVREKSIARDMCVLRYRIGV